MECRNSIKTALKGRRGEERSKKPKSSFCNNSKKGENIYIKTKKMAREVGPRGEMSQLGCGVPLSTGNIFGNILRLLRSFSSNYKAPNGSNCWLVAARMAGMTPVMGWFMPPIGKAPIGAPVEVIVGRIPDAIIGWNAKIQNSFTSTKHRKNKFNHLTFIGCDATKGAVMPPIGAIELADIGAMGCMGLNAIWPWIPPAPADMGMLVMETPIIGCTFHCPAGCGCWTAPPDFPAPLHWGVLCCINKLKFSQSAPFDLKKNDLYLGACDDLLMVKFCAKLARLDSKSPVRTFWVDVVGWGAAADMDAALAPGCSKSPKASKP